MRLRNEGSENPFRCRLELARDRYFIYGAPTGRTGRALTKVTTSSQPIGGSMRRPLEFRNRVEVADPRRLRANKYLPARHQFISLAQRSKPHIVGFWLIINRGRIERRPALGAETLQTDISAIGDLSIFCRFTGQKHERAWASDNNRSQWSAAHCLAVCAVANGRGFGISFGLERHMAAVTASINFHDTRPLSIAAADCGAWMIAAPQPA
jgi:hypothetical protein